MEKFCKTFIKSNDQLSIYIFERKEWNRFQNSNEMKFMQNQRSIDFEHVENMITYQQARYEKYGEYYFPTSICLGLYGQNYYIIDGQHRLEVIKKLNNDYTIHITVIKITSLDELDDNLKLINTNKPYVQTENNSIKGVEKFLLKEFKHYSKISKSPRIPNFNSNNVVEILNREKYANSCELFCNGLNELNDYVKNNYNKLNISKTHYDLCESNKNKKKFYAGLLSNWIIIVLSHVLYGKKYEDFDCKIFPITQKRERIPITLRKKIWSIYNNNNISGSCYVCNSAISITDFECGHVIAVCKNGTNDMDNIRCVCRACNSDMGTEHLEEYKLRISNI